MYCFAFAGLFARSPACRDDHCHVFSRFTNLQLSPVGEIPPKDERTPHRRTRGFPSLLLVDEAEPLQCFGMVGQLACPVVDCVLSSRLRLEQVVPDFRLMLFDVHAQFFAWS